MENYSYFIENKALFGSYPSQETIEILEKEGVRYFVDLTLSNLSRISVSNDIY